MFMNKIFTKYKVFHYSCNVYVLFYYKIDKYRFLNTKLKAIPRFEVYRM